MRIAPKVAVTDEQRETLERWSRGRTTPARLVRRAKMVMRAAEGKQNIEIADELGVERTGGDREGRPARRSPAKPGDGP